MHHIKWIIVLLMASVIFMLSCEVDDVVTRQPEAVATTITGRWESPTVNSATQDTTYIYYHFRADSSFEFGKHEGQDGHYETTSRLTGHYVVPAPNLLYLFFEQEYQGNGPPAMVFKADTFVFVKEFPLELKLYGLTRVFGQISGEPDRLSDSRFYIRERHSGSFVHSMFEFKGDSAFFYSMFNQEPQMPATWAYAPTEYRIKIRAPKMHFYYANNPPQEMVYALHQSKLYLTYNVRSFMLRP